MMHPLIPGDLAALIEQGEGVSVEFKKYTPNITEDVYETVCSFSNRDGGHIFLGVNDDGTVPGIHGDCVDKICDDLVVTVNNDARICPTLHLEPKKYDLGGKIIIYIRVPTGQDVCRCNGKIYDRIRDADIDITNHSNEVYRLYSRKSRSYFVDTVTHFWIDSLRPDLIGRARKMARSNTEDHPWANMSDEELLRSAGLILPDEYTQQEGVTIAGILLFGKDETIMSVLPQHKTDAIFRVVDTDRYGH